MWDSIFVVVILVVLSVAIIGVLIWTINDINGFVYGPTRPISALPAWMIQWKEIPCFSCGKKVEHVYKRHLFGNLYVCWSYVARCVLIIDLDRPVFSNAKCVSADRKNNTW